MILETEIEIIVNNQQIKYYKNLGYDAKYRKLLKIKTEHLVKGSHYKIFVSCDCCDVKKVIEFRQLKKDLSYYCSACSAKNKKKERIYHGRKNTNFKKN